MFWIAYSTFDDTYGLTASLSGPTANCLPYWGQSTIRPLNVFFSFYDVGVVAFLLVESWTVGSRFSEC
jgi:hypothetical protein